MKDILTIFNSNQLIIIIMGLFGLVGYLGKLVIERHKQDYQKRETSIEKRLDDMKNILDGLIESIKSIKEHIEENDKGTRAMLYKDCLKEAYMWKDKGYITHSAKYEFIKIWKRYNELGDGFGNKPEEIINSLEERIDN